MLKSFLQRWRDWTGDKHLDRAIRAELRRLGYASHTAKTRSVRLTAIQRPGWVQVYRFGVDTTRPTDEDTPETITLLGAARDDGRRSGIDVLLTDNPRLLHQRLEAWCEGLIRRD